MTSITPATLHRLIDWHRACAEVLDATLEMYWSGWALAPIECRVRDVLNPCWDSNI